MLFNEKVSSALHSQFNAYLFNIILSISLYLVSTPLLWMESSFYSFKLKFYEYLESTKERMEWLTVRAQNNINKKIKEAAQGKRRVERQVEASGQV